MGNPQVSILSEPNRFSLLYFDSKYEEHTVGPLLFYVIYVDFHGKQRTLLIYVLREISINLREADLGAKPLVPSLLFLIYA